jgi:hypothetical protein
MHSHRCLNASASLPLKEIPRALCSGAPRYAMQMEFSPKGGRWTRLHSSRVKPTLRITW